MAYDKRKLNTIYDKTNGYCHLCDKKLSRTNYGRHGSKGSWSVDHSKAMANGGSHHLNNLFPACISCNSEKGTLHKTTIRRRKGYGEEKSSGCFITTACVTHQGLPDDCYQLKVLRDFRDTFVLGRPEGKKLIKEYYRTAPLIVKEVNKQKNATKIYDTLFKEIDRTVSLIEQKEYFPAFEIYCKTVRELKFKYVINKQF